MPSSHQDDSRNKLASGDINYFGHKLHALSLHYFRYKLCTFDMRLIKELCNRSSCYRIHTQTQYKRLNNNSYFIWCSSFCCFKVYIIVWPFDLGLRIAPVTFGPGCKCRLLAWHLRRSKLRDLYKASLNYFCLTSVLNKVYMHHIS